MAVQQAALPDRDRSRPARHSPHPPIILAPAALQHEQRLQYDTAREHYHARLVIVSTPTIRHVAQLRYDPDADPCRPSQHNVELAIYPEIVSLAELFASGPSRPDSKRFVL